jgi:hypothetical protein
MKSRTRELMCAEVFRTSSDVDASIRGRLDGWIALFEKSESPDAAEKVELLRELKADLQVDIPF